MSFRDIYRDKVGVTFVSVYVITEQTRKIIINAVRSLVCQKI